MIEQDFAASRDLAQELLTSESLTPDLFGHERMSQYGQVGSDRGDGIGQGSPMSSHSAASLKPGRTSKAIKDARHTQPAAPSATAGVVDRRMPDARVAGTVMGI